MNGSHTVVRINRTIKERIHVDKSETHKISTALVWADDYFWSAQGYFSRTTFEYYYSFSDKKKEGNFLANKNFAN